VASGDLIMTVGYFKDNPYFAAETLTDDAYNDDDTPAVSMPDMDDIPDDVDTCNQYVGALVQLPIRDHFRLDSNNGTFITT
jgi:hypothetical protein